MYCKKRVYTVVLTIFLSAFAACSTPPPATERSTDLKAVPEIPATVPVVLNARTSALLVLDINTAQCQPNPVCTGTVPAIVSLLDKARAAKVPVVYATTLNPAGPPPALPEVAPRAGEPTVAARANKFVDTNLEDILKQRKITTLVIVGTSANGAVLYTSFHANTKGFTVVVAEDGISSREPFATRLTRYQLLNQPGFANSGNKPLADKRVTLSRSSQITFE